LGQSNRRNAKAELGEAYGSGCPSTPESGVTTEQPSIASRRKAPRICEPDVAARPTTALTSTTKEASRAGEGEDHRSTYRSGEPRNWKRKKSRSAFPPRLHGRPGKEEQIDSNADLPRHHGRPRGCAAPPQSRSCRLLGPFIRRPSTKPPSLLRPLEQKMEKSSAGRKQILARDLTAPPKHGTRRRVRSHQQSIEKKT
jgi:hypothetical protein